MPESLFLIKLQAERCNFIKKEALVQVFPREFYEISKNTYFIGTPLGDWFCQNYLMSFHLEKLCFCF